MQIWRDILGKLFDLE